MKTTQIYLSINAILIIALVFLIGHIMTSNTKEVFYVDKETLYNQFQMTKELKSQGDKILKAKKARTIEIERQLVNNENDNTDENRQMQNEINILNRDLQKTQYQLIEDLNEKVNTRVKSYMKDFAKKEEIEIILGSSALYVNEATDLTAKAINYVNDRYNGLNY